MHAVIGILVFLAVIGAILAYAVKQGKKKDQEDLKASAEFAEACETCKPEIAEEAVKIELAIEPKVAPVAKKKPAKMAAKKKAKSVKKIEVVETFELQPVAPKARKPRAKKPTV